MKKKVIVVLTPYEAETLFLGVSNYWHKPWRLSTVGRILRKLTVARSRAGCFREVGS
jgi:hypothetical protein